MATTDSNGIVRVEASDDVAPLHPVLNSLAQSVSNAFNAETRIYPVANAAGRTAKVTEIGVGNISATRPLFVWRADAPTGRNLEYTVNGSTWLYYSSSADDTGWVNATIAGSLTGSIKYRKVRNRVDVAYDLTGTVGGDMLLATIPYSNSSGIVCPGAEYQYGTSGNRPLYNNGTSGDARIPGQPGTTRRVGSLSYLAT